MSETPLTSTPLDLTPFRRVLQILGRDDPAAKLRLGRMRPGRGQFDTLPITNEEAPRILTVLAGQENLWFEINESSYHEVRGRSKEGDITRLTCVWADLDFKGEAGPGSRQGMGSEQATRDVIDDLTRLIGVPPAVIIRSGNGLQPLWPIRNGHITPGLNDVAMKTLLRRWGVLVRQVAQNRGGDADGVFDLPRILRVPGPPNVKDPEHPKPTGAEFPEGWEAFDVDELREMLDDLGVYYTDEVTVGLEPVSLMTAWEWAERDCSFVDQVREWIRTDQPNARHQWGLKTASIIQGLIRYGCVTEQTFYQLRTEFIDRFTDLCVNTEPKRQVAAGEVPQMWKWAQARAESWTDEKLVDEMRGHSHMLEDLAAAEAQAEVTYAGPDPFIAPPLPPLVETPVMEEPKPILPPPLVAPTVSDLSTTSGISALLQDLVAQPAAPTEDADDTGITGSHRTSTRLGAARFSDIGNAERIAQAFKKRFIFVPGRGFFVWEGGRYVPDTAGQHMESAKDVMMGMQAQATTEKQKSWAAKSLNAGPLTAAVRLATTTDQLVVKLSELDAQPFELCTPGGILDIRKGTLRAGDPATDRHTLCTAVTPDFTASAPEFEKWLLWALDTEERVRYVQRLLGVALIGQLLAHVFPMFIGPGGNGKTTLLSIALGVLGQYGKSMPPKFLVEKRSEQHPTEIANLQGVRLAVASEVPAKSAFDEDLVKVISGEPTLSGRFMRSDFIEFKNTTTLFLAANHLPRVRYGGRGWWRRTRKIDFHNIATVEDRDLPDRIIRNEGPAVLAWMVRGAMDYLADGEQPPVEVLTATMEYEREEDSLLKFVEETYSFTEGVQIPRDMVYSTYERWAMQNRLEVLSSTQFYRELLTRWPKLGTSGDERTFIGLSPKAWVEAGLEEFIKGEPS